MSLYNMLFGENEKANALLKILGVEKEDIGRYRDCYIEGDHIVILTRTGGGNREYHNGDNAMLQNLDDYSHDQDCEFDSTYAVFYFNVPEEHKEEFQCLKE